METTSPTLLIGLRDPENRAAWNRFVTIYSPLLMQFGKRLSLQDDDSADLMQDLWIVLLRRMQTFAYNPRQGFRGFLWVCYLNLARNWYSNRDRAWPEALELAREDVPILEEAEFQQYVRARVLKIIKHRFEEPVWKAFEEFYLNGRSAREIDDEFGIPAANVWVYCGRVAKELEQELADLKE